MRLTPGANHLGINLLIHFCRLDRFINVNIFTNAMKQPSFETLELNKLLNIFTGLTKGPSLIKKLE